jgi:hypothetical protein
MCPLILLNKRRKTAKIRMMIREHKRAVALGLEGCWCSKDAPAEW